MSRVARRPRSLRSSLAWAIVALYVVLVAIALRLLFIHGIKRAGHQHYTRVHVPQAVRTINSSTLGDRKTVRPVSEVSKDRQR